MVFVLLVKLSHVFIYILKKKKRHVEKKWHGVKKKGNKIITRFHFKVSTSFFHNFKPENKNNKTIVNNTQSPHLNIKQVTEVSYSSFLPGCQQSYQKINPYPSASQYIEQEEFKHPNNKFYFYYICILYTLCISRQMVLENDSFWSFCI